MPEHESVRSTAEAIGRITCIKTGEEIGLLYRWDNGETQAAMYNDGLAASPTFEDQATRPDLGANRG
ncbi:hypothetical protein [Aestuariibius sp. HNIBRBA575]|uniref:hypothetical protein n=1 Tax=Aestuariibius sp. HNIBRBA575 TaxID=3233343 RepID=UPI0034A49C3A